MYHPTFSFHLSLSLSLSPVENEKERDREIDRLGICAVVGLEVVLFLWPVHFMMLLLLLGSFAALLLFVGLKKANCVINH